MSNAGDEEDPDDDFIKRQGSQPANPNQATIREGFLKKKSPAGMIRKVWQSRYFKLMPDCMTYSKKKDDKEAQGVIPLTSIGQVTLPKNKGAGRFDVEVVGTGAVRIFCLMAKTDKEAIEWVETLKNLQKNAVRTPVITKQESKDLLKGAKSPNSSSGNKFWKNAKLGSRDARLTNVSENDEPPPDSEEAAIKLHIISQDTSFTGFGNLYHALDWRRKGSSYLLHAVNKKDKLASSAKPLFKEMKELTHRFIFRQAYIGDTEDYVFAMYESTGDQNNLAHHLKVLQKFPEDVVLLLGAQLTLALHTIHDAAGVGFWTMSPHKLWIGSDGALVIKEPLLCLQDIPSEMMLPSYRSPEHFQAGGEQVMADWWRLGLIMYELLTGVNPFAKTPEALIPKFKVTELKFPSEVSKSTQDLIKALMNPNPSTRLGHENDAAEVRASPLWGPTIGQSWEAILTQPIISPWLKLHVLEPAQARVKRDTRPHADKEESELELRIIGTRGVALEEADTGADRTQKKPSKREEKKLPPKLMCKVDFEGQYHTTPTLVTAINSQLEWNERFTFKFRGHVHSTNNLVIQVVDHSKGYGLIVGDISLQLIEMKPGPPLLQWHSILTPEATANGEVLLSVALTKADEKSNANAHLPKPLAHYFGSELASQAGGPPEGGEEDDPRLFGDGKADDDDDGDVRDDTTATRDTAGNLVLSISKLREKRKKDPPKRFNRAPFDLDLTYITPKLIALSSPTESKGHTPDQLAAFFKQFHPDYAIYHLSHFKFATDKFKVSDCPISDYSVPTFPGLVALIERAWAFYNSKDSAVVAVECTTGKGPSGMVIACLLLMAGLAESADEALFLFARKRTPEAIAVTLPSQRRYVHYFEQYLRDYQRISRPFPSEGKSVTLLRIRLTTLYSLEVGGGCDPYFVCVGPGPKFSVLYDHKKATKGNLTEYKGTDGHADLVCVDEADSSPTGCTLYGDVKFVFFDHFKGHSGTDTKLFQFWLNTAFISSDYVCLDKVHIDGAQNKMFKASFRLELFFTSA